MMLLLLAATAAAPVEQAERAFAAMAQTEGQWTAFRAFAAPDAIMLLDGPKPAAPFLDHRADPPQSVMWWPARTITSCDGKLAFSTGPWRGRGGTQTGRYMTVWRKDADGWRWLYDGGSEDRGSPAGDTVVAVRAACGDARNVPSIQDMIAGGTSPDGSLRWGLSKLDGDQYRLTVTYRGMAGWKSESAVVG